MTEEEYQAKILEHENTINSLNIQIEDFKTKETTTQEDITKLNNDIKNLKDHNMSLFLRITGQQQTDANNNQTTNQQPQQKETTLNDIITSLTTKEA